MFAFEVTCVSISAEGDICAVGHSSGVINLWNVASVTAYGLQRSKVSPLTRTMNFVPVPVKHAHSMLIHISTCQHFLDCAHSKGIMQAKFREVKFDLEHLATTNGHLRSVA